ncbi:hypothetical protein KC343_g5454 [Hortaea werneckii]|nr:hypothetical protein KC352_g12149 [Hortaea werneckii]KAI7570484.1 hypothetical protein KC317_g2421 [Hortaea werneckii]KAI7617739.1 hypothetical protein KC346_g5314 [Hortaea werneckii]KAI7629048.1 hypothetical protein KC343_g5454 [Hortaea werneckii]KAI7671980.1 hypothetical protein KC319_g5432 [Hortaea werneckii]
MSRYLNHISGKESGKDSNKKKADEENTPGLSSQPTDKPSMKGGTKKPKDFDKWIENQKAKKAKADGGSAVPKRPPPASKSAGATSRGKDPPLPPKDLKPRMGKKAREGAVKDDKTKKKPRKESVAPVDDEAGPQKPRKNSKGRLDTTANGEQRTSRPKDKDTPQPNEASIPESPGKTDSESEDGDPLNRHTKYPFELTSQDADIAARYRQRLQTLCRAIDDDSTPPDPDRSKEEEDPELLGVFEEVSDRFEEVRKWMRMVQMDREAFEKLEERAGAEGGEGRERGDVEEGEILEEVEAGEGVEGGEGEDEDEDERFSRGLETIEEEKTDELEVAAEPEHHSSNQVQGDETPGYRPSPAQSPPHVPSDDEPSQLEPQGPAAAESNPTMDRDQQLSGQLQRGETPGYLSSSSQNPAQLPSENEPQQEPSDQLEGRETPGYISSPSRSPPRMPSEDEPKQELPDPRQQRETPGYPSSSEQGSPELPAQTEPQQEIPDQRQQRETPGYLSSSSQSPPRPPAINEVGGTEPQGGAAPQTILSSILSSLQQHADEMSRNDPHASPPAPANQNNDTAAENVDQAPDALEQETEASQASVGNPPADTLGAAATNTDPGNENDEVDYLFSETALGPVEYSPEIEPRPRFEPATELPRSDVSVLDGDEGAFVPHARPPNASLPGLGLYLPPTTTAAVSSVEASAGPTANLPGLHSGQGLDARAQPSVSTSSTAENGFEGDVDSQSPNTARSIGADGSTDHDGSAGHSSPSKATKRKSTSEDDESPRKKSRSNSPTETQFR